MDCCLGWFCGIDCGLFRLIGLLHVAWWWFNSVVRFCLLTCGFVWVSCLRVIVGYVVYSGDMVVCLFVYWLVLGCFSGGLMLLIVLVSNFFHFVVVAIWLWFILLWRSGCGCDCCGLLVLMLVDCWRVFCVALSWMLPVIRC